jgi:hypothetical protein
MTEIERWDTVMRVWEQVCVRVDYKAMCFYLPTGRKEVFTCLPNNYVFLAFQHMNLC